MSSLTEFERIQILIYIGYGDKKRSCAEALQIFKENNPNRVLTKKSTISRTYNQFWNHQSIKDLPKTGRPNIATNINVTQNVIEGVYENPHSSAQQLANENVISKTSVCRILRRDIGVRTGAAGCSFAAPGQ